MEEHARVQTFDDIPLEGGKSRMTRSIDSRAIELATFARSQPAFPSRNFNAGVARLRTFRARKDLR